MLHEGVLVIVMVVFSLVITGQARDHSGPQGTLQLLSSNLKVYSDPEQALVSVTEVFFMFSTNVFLILKSTTASNQGQAQFIIS